LNSKRKPTQFTSKSAP